MATTARLGIDITAVDKTRAAFASVNRQLGTVTTSVNRTLRGINQFRGAFAAAFVGLGIRAAVDSIGRAVDKNLVDKADVMKSRWSTTWDAWGNTADRLITEAAMGLDGLITDSGKALGLIDQIASQSVNRSGMGNFITAPAGATYGKGLPNNVTDISKQAQAIQTVNSALKENAIGYREAEKAKQEWSFNKDILGNLDQQISLLEVQRDAFGKSASEIDALVAKQQALNEAIAAGHPLNERELILLEERISYMKKLGAQIDANREKEREQEDAMRKSQQEAQEFQQNFKDAFSGFFQSVAQGVNVVKALQSELETLSQRMLKMATDKIFDMLLQYLMQQPGGMPTGPGLNNGNFGGYYAAGGNLGAGKWGIAGEAGPELISGPATITPFSKLGGGGTSVKVYDRNNSRITTRERDDGFGRRELEVLIDQRQASNNANPYSNASRTLSARGAAPGRKQR